MLPDLVLASASPRRRELLAGLGVRFTLRAADLDETPRPGEDPETTVLRLAREKAAAVARPGGLVLAAGTDGGLDGGIPGQPRTRTWCSTATPGASPGPPRTPAACSPASPAASTPCSPVSPWRSPAPA